MSKNSHTSDRQNGKSVSKKQQIQKYYHPRKWVNKGRGRFNTTAIEEVLIAMKITGPFYVQIKIPAEKEGGN